jgi:hypothetical protein
LILTERQPKALATRQELEQWLQEGIIAAKMGQMQPARFRLLDVVEQDQTNETAWYWLYRVFDRAEDRRVCLENLLVINPGNGWARQELLNYLTPAETARWQAQAPPAPPTRPLTLKLVAAFWLGISIIFLGGGIIAGSEWLITGLRSRSIPYYVTALQAFELMVAVMFVIIGIIGLNVAAGLYARTTAGFYGSLLLALGLLLVGPTISLIASPPNYLTMICTGGLSGMIVLLTLASYPGFSHAQHNHDTSTK